MKIKNITKWLSLVFVTVLFPFALFAQQGLLNNGAHVVITTGTSLYIDGGLDLYNSSDTITNDGIIIITDTGDFINDDAFISGTNTNVKMLGEVQDIGGTQSTEFSNLVIGGTDDKTISIDSYVRDSLIFQANHVVLGTDDMILKEDAITFGSDSTQFVVTNTATGYLIKYTVPGSTDFLFPVGDTTFSYKPAILNVNVSDTFNVRVEAGVNPTTGNDPAYIQYTWIVQEETPTLSKTGTLDLGWLHGDEGSQFVPASARMSHYDGVSWNIELGGPGAVVSPIAYYHYDKVAGITNFNSTNNRFIVGSSDPVVADAGADITICRGWCDTLQASATGGVTPYTYSWSSGSTSDTAIVCPIQTTTYIVTVTDVTGLNSDVDSVVVTVVFPNASAGADISVCSGNDTTLTASGGVSYKWNTSPADTTATITIIPTTTTTYTVTVTDASGCTNTDEVVVTLLTLPNMPDVADQQLCTYEDIVTFDVNSPNLTYQYYWYDSIGGSPLSCISPCTSITINGVNVPDKYYVRSEDVNGCFSPYDTVYVTAAPMPIADFSIDNTPPYYEKKVLQFRDESTGAPVNTWNWDFGDGGYSTDRNPEHQYDLEGFYTVSLIVCTSPTIRECCDTIEKTDYVEIVKKTQIYVPTTFTPNGDTKNDILKVLGDGIITIKFKVFNQWGIILFESSSQDDGWDGTYKGNPQPEGNYVYIIEATTVDDQTVNQQGIVSIVR